MKNFAKLIIIIIIITLSTNTLAISNSIESTTKKVDINGETRNINMVIIDLNNPDIELKVEISNDNIGGDESFSSFIERKNMDAAINANFFDSYNTLEPYGTIMKDGKIVYLEGENTSMMIENGKEVSFDRFKTVLKGNLDGKEQNEWNHQKQAMDFYLFDAWYINNVPIDPTGVYIYTPERGESIEVEGGIAVEVIDNTVTKVAKNVQLINIPSNGYVIYYATQSGSEEYVYSRFKTGRIVDFEFESTYTNEEVAEEVIEDKPEPPKEPLKLYGCVDKTTKNYWSNEINGMDFNLFSVWYINNKPVDSTGVYLYTPEKGETLEVPKGNAIIVENGRIIEVLFDTVKFDIPKDGFVIYYGKDAADKSYLQARFSIGKTVDFYDADTKDINTEEIIKDAVEKYRYVLYQDMKISKSLSDIDLSKVNGLISAGPYLVKKGEIIVNAEKEGFKEDKIIKNRAGRSALGLTKDNKLLLVTVPNVNIEELAQIMLNLGSVEAMNLDGGASSALYANGKVLTKPGRKLSTVLAVYDNSNNSKLSFENRIKNGEFRNIKDLKAIEKDIINYTSNKFSDVKKDTWYSKTVSYLVGMNIINGYSDGTFKPNNTINVDAFIKMVITSLGYNLEYGKDYWASNYINKAKELGLVNENEFDVYNKPITRKEMARIIVRAMDEEPIIELDKLRNSVKDIDNLDEKLQNIILKAYGLGIITGYGDGTFKPNNTAYRSEAATVIIRMLDKDTRKIPQI